MSKSVLIALQTFSCLIAFTFLAAPLKTSANNYVFAWPFVDEASMTPRGASSKGPNVSLDTEVNPVFAQINDPSLSDYERDRLAILSMIGPHRVTFDFLEVVGFEAGFSPAQPYRSWGTEYVYLISDDGDKISLQHILVMHIQKDDGELQGPYVTKHWRQDWQYQAKVAHTYKGHNNWHATKLNRKQRKHQWLQTVWQVDDSPRYASWGQWQHEAEYSTWLSGETWRPLPRREYSVRDDFDVLIGTNRHTVMADGWLQEEHNEKVALTEAGEIKQRLAREYGVARYQRIKDYDFSAGAEYFSKTQAYWSLVRKHWETLMQTHSRITLQAPTDRSGSFMALYKRALEINDGTEYTAEENQLFVEETIQNLLATNNDVKKPTKGY